MAAIKLILALMLACSFVQGQGEGTKLWRADREAWIEQQLEYNQVPQEDREDLVRFCSTIPLSDNDISHPFAECLYGWERLSKRQESSFYKEDWYGLVDAAPDGDLAIGCELKKDESFEVRTSFTFKDWLNGGVPISRKKKDRVHLELSFSQVVSDPEFGLRFKTEVINYQWPSRSWSRKSLPKGWHEDMHIARFYGEEAADILRKIYRSRHVSWTDRKVGETNTVLVTSRGRKRIEQIMGFCQLSLDAHGAGKASRGKR